jgi:hypothetical protein
MHSPEKVFFSPLYMFMPGHLDMIHNTEVKHLVTSCLRMEQPQGQWSEEMERTGS